MSDPLTGTGAGNSITNDEEPNGIGAGMRNGLGMKIGSGMFWGRIGGKRGRGGKQAGRQEKEIYPNGTGRYLGKEKSTQSDGSVDGLTYRGMQDQYTIYMRPTHECMYL